MGRRDDNFLDDERADAALRNLLARLGEPTDLPPPPDLATRTARRLPAAPPAIAARAEARAAALRLALGVALVGALALVAGLGLWSALSGRDQLAMLFGDGGSGLSRALLTLHLLAKPLLRTVGLPLLVSALVAVGGAAWLWRWMLRRTPIYDTAENAP